VTGLVLASPFFDVVPPTPGLRRRRVSVGALVDGSPIALSVTAIRGRTDGPTIYLQAGIHGDEATGVAVAMAVLAGLRADAIRGTFVAIPVANPASFLTRTRGFALEERGPIDLNRNYPGAAGGLLSERIAAGIFASCVAPADITIDLHSALAGCAIGSFSYVDPDDDVHGTLRVREKLAAAFNADFLYRKARAAKLGTSDMSRSLAAQADLQGKVAVTLELGQADRVDWSTMERGVEGVRNVLRAAALLEGPVEAVPHKVVFSKITPVHAESSGLFRPALEIGAIVAEGATIGTVTDVHTLRARRVRAPSRGRILRLMLRPFVMVGAELAWVVE
jgi:predicted deacylase